MPSRMATALRGTAPRLSEPLTQGDRTMADEFSVTVAGVTYQIPQRTPLAYEIFMLGVLRRAGLDVLGMPREASATAEAVTESLTRFVAQIFDANAVAGLLGGTLVPVGEAWTADAAIERGKLFLSLTDDADKQALLSALPHALVRVLPTGAPA
jgi:hypothetical protein